MKKSLSLFLVLILVCLSVSACLAEETNAAWINSNVIGNVTEDMETSPKDDFHLWVNKDWLVNAEIPEGQSRVTSFDDRNQEVREQILTLLEDDSQESFEAKLVQQLYNDYMDMDTRNERGMEPVMPYVKAIQEVQTLDELTAFMAREDQPSNRLSSDGVMADLMNSDQNAVYISNSGFSLQDADEYKNLTSVGERRKNALETLEVALLERVGYTHEEAVAIKQQAFDMESQIASVCLGSSDQVQTDYYYRVYNPLTLDELKEKSPNFPIVEMLKPYIDAGVERFILMDTAWLDKINELYTQENVEAFKAVILCNTLRQSVSYLDQECIDLNDRAQSILIGMEYHSVLRDKAYSLCNNYLNMAVAKMYVENYVTEETKAEVTEIINEVVETYEKRLQNTEWLGEETRAKAIEKLENLTVRVAYPDDWSLYDFSDIHLKTKEEGGSLMDDVNEISLHMMRENVKMSTEPVNHEKWGEGIGPQTVNAFYNPVDNSINILSGILGGIFYSPDASDAQNLGTIGVVIGHEITHGFDSTGSQYDEAGNLNNWWTEEDAAAFTERTDKVKAYFGAIEMLPGMYVDGQLTIGETVADLGALSCMLEIAKGKENFDYEAFFTSFAKIWGEQQTAEVEESMLQQNAHAPGSLRTNVTVQQFQEFYDTFDVQEGDGMYLAPEERLSVW